MRQTRRVVHLAGTWASAACVLPVILFCALGGNFIALFLMAYVVLTLFGVLFLFFPEIAREERRTVRLRRASLVGLWTMLLISVPMTEWPLRVSFCYAQPALEQIADQLERGENPALPRRVGLFTMSHAETEIEWKPESKKGKRITCIWISTYSTGAEPIGFMRGACETYKDKNVIYLLGDAAFLYHVRGNWFQAIRE